MSSRGLDILQREVCDELLRTHEFGRIVTHIGDMPAAFPVFYTVIDGDIVFRTDPGTKLAAAALHSRVTFEIDDAVEAWSVMAVGFAEEVRRPEEIDRALDALARYWAPGERQRVIRITPGRVTGRRLRMPTHTGTAAESGGQP